MPEILCLFARPHDDLHRVLLAEPTFTGHVYVMPATDAGLIANPDEQLTVVRVVEPPDARDVPDDAATTRFRWLRRVLPHPELAAALAKFAHATGATLAWFYWHERGDDLYNDAALLFGPAPAARQVYARQTFLWGDEDSASFTPDAGDWNDSPFQVAMAKLGFDASTEYFIPEDQQAFDWDRYRLPT